MIRSSKPEDNQLLQIFDNRVIQSNSIQIYQNIKLLIKKLQGQKNSK